jgi:hypothetical protein
VALGYISQVIAESFKRILPVRGKARVLASVFVKKRCYGAENLLTFSSSSGRRSSCF